MRDYGIVSPMFWIGQTGRALRKYPDAQRVAIYFMTAPSSDMTGVFYCPMLSILNDVGQFRAPSKPLDSPLHDEFDAIQASLEGVRQAILYLMDINFCFYDFESEFVFVTEMARWQIGESLKEKDNRVAGVKRSIKSMPKALAARFIERYNDDYCLGYDKNDFIAIDRPFKAPSKPLRSQEQEQEQEQEQDQKYINHNKEITEIRYGGTTGPDPVCLENSLSENIRDAQDNLCDEKKFEDDDSILTVLEVIKLCSYYRLKVARTQKLVDTVKSGRVSVGMVKECMDIAKAQQKPGSYFVGCLANAIHEPDRYLTTIQKIRRSAQKEKEAEQFLLEHGDEVF